MPRTIVLTLALALALAACSRAPAEPEPVASVAPPPTVAPLSWSAPGSWTVMPAPPSGPKKASYKIPKTGNDKEEAELHVFFFGTGSKGDADANFKAWFDQFDGDVGASAAREKFEVHGLGVETVEVAGTYKIAMGPPVGPKKQPAMSMVKKDFRMVGAVVKTPDRGNWFFKLIGPNDTVQSAKSAMRTLLESVK